MERLQTITEEAGRPGAAKFRAAALLEGVRISRDKVEEFVKKQSVSQVFKRLPASSGRVTATSENASWQLDLIDWIKQVRATNMGARFVLCCVDIFSRKMYAEPQPNKTPQTTLAAFRRILADSGEGPKKVDTDLGAEFGGVLTTGSTNEGLDIGTRIHASSTPWGSLAVQFGRRRTSRRRR